MAAFTGLEARERMAVLKSFADDTSGSMANVYTAKTISLNLKVTSRTGRR